VLQPVKKVTAGVAALAALALGGSAFANAAASPSTATPDGSTTGPARPTFPAHGTAAHENLEKPVSGSAATQARAAAIKAAGGGTAGEVTTDVSGHGYEVTVTKGDGSKAEVHLNESFGLDDHAGLSG
jgi:hypothetical protein